MTDFSGRRRRCFTAAIGLAFGVLGCGGGGAAIDAGNPTGPGPAPEFPAPPAPPSSNVVTATGASFSPVTITIAQGASVTWQIVGNTHNVTFGTNKPTGGDAPNATPGSTVTQRSPQRARIRTNARSIRAWWERWSCRERPRRYSPRSPSRPQRRVSTSERRRSSLPRRAIRTGARWPDILRRGHSQHRSRQRGIAHVCDARHVRPSVHTALRDDRPGRRDVGILRRVTRHRFRGCSAAGRQHSRKLARVARVPYLPHRRGLRLL